MRTHHNIGRLLGLDTRLRFAPALLDRRRLHRNILTRTFLLALLSLLLAGCTLGGVDVEQERATGLAGELTGGHTFGQTFTLQYPGLYRIDLYTATYARDNTHPVIFRVKSSPDAANNLVHLELPAAQISNSGPTIITFPPLTHTTDLTLYFSLESPRSVPGDAITVYRHEEDIYQGGQMFVDGQPTGGDIAFIAYTQETFTLADIWHDFYSRASQDRPFFIFYCSVLGLLVVALVVTLVWPRSRPPVPPEGETGETE